MAWRRAAPRLDRIGGVGEDYSAEAAESHGHHAGSLCLSGLMLRRAASSPGAQSIGANTASLQRHSSPILSLPNTSSMGFDLAAALKGASIHALALRTHARIL